MKIVGVKKINGWFNGHTVYRYAFDQPWTRDEIMGLCPLGDVDYFADYPRPLFLLFGAGGMQVKGIEGQDTCLAIFPNRGLMKQVFEQRFESC